MTKTKSKFFLFAAIFLFLNVYFVSVDSVRNIANAECGDVSEDYDIGGCAYSGTITEPALTESSENLCNNACPDAECSSYGVCVGGITQADCTGYGAGYIISDDGTDCVLPAGGEGTDYADCLAQGSGVAYCSQFNDSLCSTNAECITDHGMGFVCDQVTRTCEERSTDVNVSTASGDICYTDSECNWYSTCKLGNNGAAGVCQGYLNFSDPQTALNALGLPDGYRIDPSGLVTNPNGTTQQLTPTQLSQLQNTPVALPSYPRTTASPAGPKCGTDGTFQDIGGVCFPTNTGLSAAPISVILMNIFKWLMGLFMTLAVLAFVISGIQYFMASGDESMAEKAKENATYAVIGIIIGFSGFIIIQAIAAALSGTSIFF